MPILQWSDIVEVTHDDAKQSILNLLETVGFAATSWQEGSVPLAFVETSAEIWSQLSTVAVFLKTMALNDTSVGDALTRFSSSHYDNERLLAVAAQRTTALACTADAGPHSFNVGDVVIAHPDGNTYRNVDDGITVYPVTIPSGGTATGLTFEAEVAGIASNKGADTVTIMVTTLAGVTVISDEIKRTGTDAEADPRLRLRNTTKWPLLTRFQLTASAVQNLAYTAAQGVTTVEVDATNPRGAGTFDVYVAGELTTAGGADVDAVQAKIDRYVFGSSAPTKTCLVIAAPEQPLDLTGTIYYQGAYTSAQLLGATTAALIEFIKTIPLGGMDFSPGPNHVVPYNDITDVLREVQISGQAVKKTVVMSSPSSDTFVAPFGKVTLGTVALTFIRADI